MTLMEEYVDEMRQLFRAIAVPITLVVIIFGVSAVLAALILWAFGTPVE